MSQRADSSVSNSKEANLKYASDLARANLRYYDTKDAGGGKKTLVGFLLGSAGVNAVAAAVAHTTGDVDNARLFAGRYAAAADHCIPIKMHQCGSDEVGQI